MAADMRAIGQLIDICSKKIVLLKHAQNANVGDNAQY
jgi:hypothetical protein